MTRDLDIHMHGDELMGLGIPDEEIVACCRDNRGLVSGQLVERLRPWLEPRGFEPQQPIHVTCYNDRDGYDFRQRLISN